MAPLDGKSRAALRDTAFAYIDSKGRRLLPINDAPHVRNALSRFEQVAFESDAAREQARQRLLKAAKKFGVSTIGFFDGQLRTERKKGELRAQAAKFATLPRGVVTFLLADVEGSTPLARTLGDEFPALLNDVWTILRTAVRRQGGDGVDIRGDEYFAVFRRPIDGLNAAVAAQLSMGSHEWPPGGPVRVRIGLHTGRTTIADAAYAGITVHTVARVCSSGHGGQILVSAASLAALAPLAPIGISFRDLGRYTLAGLAEPESLYQVEAAGLIATFPRLRAKPARSVPANTAG